VKALRDLEVSIHRAWPGVHEPSVFLQSERAPEHRATRLRLRVNCVEATILIPDNIAEEEPATALLAGAIEVLAGGIRQGTERA